MAGLLPGTQPADAFADTEEKLNFDSQFATQEYIQFLIRKDCFDVEQICEKPEQFDEAVWIYEHLRMLIAELNKLVICLDKICTSSSCPVMCANDLEFLCACHGPRPVKCSAISYTVHTLAYFTSLLTHPDLFPNRVRITAKAAKEFAGVCRRLYRIFAHAHHHHTDTFAKFEGDSALCARFLKLIQVFNLLAPAMCNPPINL
mmetsp:Transcript_46954/g.92434  ORF Transcript_46954/g.92434 Transcript_46954/m.92434 type:complete len:203 (+) Transcript_46954:63-671(+)|eukprot:CAMPEP_0175141270 /NCGR_PEP_ID=MMETSP0087-20121206/12013_1 /TAXON_ID=136419 /ORGANISM="Unknown Unknown, Strain D1" /LENGTH=202 /DNA_ID=CAMNT_0016424669 /DNA_START=64 /DNA_END=672 /DNA_ORIENTATION=-